MPNGLPHDLAADVALVADLLLGRPGAPERFFQRTQSLVTSVARRYFSRPEDIEDARQEVFMRLFARDWRVVRLWGRERPLDAYIARIARNVCLDILRRAADAPMDDSNWDIVDENPSVDPESVFFALQLRECFQRAIEALSETYRRIVTLRHVEQLSHQEIADRTGHTIGYVSPTLARGEQYLKDELKVHCSDHLGLFAAATR